MRRSEPARLVIADDHELARAGLRSVFSSEPCLEVVGEASNGREAIALCRRLQPDLVLMDARMPEMDGLTATHAIRQECPTTKVIIVTMHGNAAYLLQALKAGAAGYMLKDATEQQFISAVRRVLRGEILLNPELATQVLRRLTNGTTGQRELPAERLTPREQEVLGLLVQGKTNREIAQALNISVGTVKAHVEHIIAKLGVSDRTQAAVRAVELGLLDTVTT